MGVREHVPEKVEVREHAPEQVEGRKQVVKETTVEVGCGAVTR